MKRICIFILCFMFIGCIKQTPFNSRNYRIGVEKITNIGSPMISSKKGTHITGSKHVPFHGYVEVDEYSKDTFKEELIYTGRSGNTIHLSYREYVQSLARPSFFQELRYDIGRSGTITFRGYKIHVLDANNENIRFVVGSD